MHQRIRAVTCAVGIMATTLGLTSLSMSSGGALSKATATGRGAHGGVALVKSGESRSGEPRLAQSGQPEMFAGIRPSDEWTLRPPTDAQCRSAMADEGIRQCFDPDDIRAAYGVNRLIAAKDEGRGQTIVIIDSFGSPTIRKDLRTFDRGYKLVGPPSLRVLAPLGTVPFNPDVDSGWAAETTLDVEWSHAMAPLARIVVLTSPVAETEGTVGLGDFLALEQYALDHGLGNIISQSWAATENTLEKSPGRTLVARFEAFYARADRHHITVLGSTGDTGTQNPSDGSATRTYRQPTVNFPASSPLVTAVGGTSLHTSRSGRWSSETVWNDGFGGGAGGGGISQLFAEPSYQKSLPSSAQSQLGDHRGVPDISWNANPDTAILIYSSFGGAGNTGYSIIGGTSEGAPQWAGLVADVNQARGNPIGFLNPTLYSLAARDKGSFHDIVKGTNAYEGVRGYSAGPGWDPASGLGTPRSGSDALVTALINAPGRT